MNCRWIYCCLKHLFEVLKQLLGFGRILTPLGHLYPWIKRIILVSLAPSAEWYTQVVLSAERRGGCSPGAPV